MTPEQYKQLVMDDKLFNALSDLDKKKFQLIDAEVNNLFNYYDQQGQSPSEADVEQLIKDMTEQVNAKYIEPGMAQIGDATFGEKVGTPFIYKVTPAAETAPPYNIPQSPVSKQPVTLGTAVARQQVVPEVRGKFDVRTYLNAEEIEKNLIQQGLTKEAASDTTAGMLKAFDIEFSKDFNQDPSVVFDKVLNEIGSIGDAPMIKETEEFQKQKGPVDPVIYAFGRQTTEGKIPNYTPTQIAYLKEFKTRQKSRITENEYNKIKNLGIDYVWLTLPDGSRAMLPQEVVEYVRSTPADLAPAVYSDKVDKLIREATSVSAPTMVTDQTKKKPLDINALSEVRGRLKTGADDWYLDPDLKSKVIADPEKYTERGWFTDVSPLGGTKETTLGWSLRSALTVPNAVAGTAVEMLSSDDLSGIRKEYRKKEQPLYEDNPILANIALNKGFTGEALEASDALNLEGMYKYATVGGAFMADILDPSLTITVATAKVPQNTAKIYKAQKAIYGTADAGKAARMATEFAIGEVLEDFNGIAALNKISGDKAGKFLNAQYGDVSLHLSKQFDDELKARSIVKNGVDNGKSLDDVMADLDSLGLNKTAYAEALGKKADSISDADTFKVAIDDLDSTNNIVQNYKGLIDEYDETYKYVDNVVGNKASTEDRFWRDEDWFLNVDKRKFNPENINRDVVNTLRKSIFDTPFKSAKQQLLEALNTAYARKIFAEVNPQSKAFKGVVAITKNTWAKPEVAEQIFETWRSSPLGQAVNTISKGLMDNTIQIVRKVVTPSFEEMSTGVSRPLGTFAQAPNFKNAYKMSEEAADELRRRLKQIDMPKEKANQIDTLLANEQLIYAEDFRAIIDSGIDNIAKARTGVILASDVEKLPLAARKQMLGAAEAVGSRGRGIFDLITIKGLKESVTEAIKYPIKKIKEKLGIAVNETSLPLPPRGQLSVNQLRLINESQQQLSGLDTKLRRSVKALMTSPQLQSDYGIIGEVNELEALGALIVGPKKDPSTGVNVMDDVARDAQALQLKNGMSWAVNRIFFEGTTYESALDRLTGYNILYNNKILSDTGALKLEEEIDKIVFDIVDGKKDFWKGYTEMIEVYRGLLANPVNINPSVVSKNLSAGIFENVDKLRTHLTVGMYYYVEGNRIIDANIRKFMDPEFGKIIAEIDLISKDLAAIGVKFTSDDLKQMLFYDVQNVINQRPTRKLRNTNISKKISDYKQDYIDPTGQLEELQENLNILLADKARLERSLEDLKLIGVDRKTLKRQQDAIDAVNKAIGNRKKAIGSIIPNLDVASVDIAQRIMNLSDVILARNGLAKNIAMNPHDVTSMARQLTIDNKNAAELILGPQFVKEFNKSIGTDRFALLNEGIDTWMRKELQKSPEMWDACKTFLKWMNSFRYSVLLNFRLRFHGVNLLTANAITYATVGRMVGPKGVQEGLKIVNAVDPNSINYIKAAVKTPAGDVYTYGDLYEILVTSGIRSEYGFLTEGFSDDRLLRWLGSNGNVGPSVSKYAAKASQKMSDIIVAEDMMFRGAILKSALEEGKSIEEATDLAKKSLFDYNDMGATEKAVASYLFIFYAFNRQNFVNFMNSMTDPKAFSRLIKILKTDRNFDIIRDHANDGKRFDPKLFFPDYLQGRGRWSMYPGQPNNYYLMNPPIPSVDAFMLLDQMVQGNVTKLINKQLSPGWKEIIGLEDSFTKSGNKRINTQYIKALAAFKDDPMDLAAFIQDFVGGVVIPIPATNDKGGVNGYIYELDEAQQANWTYWNKTISFTGIGAPINDYIKLWQMISSPEQFDFPSRAVALPYAIGATTPVKVPSQQTTDWRSITERTRAMNQRAMKLGAGEKALEEMQTEEILKGENKE